MSLLILFNQQVHVQQPVPVVPSQQRVYTDFYFSQTKVLSFYQDGAFGASYFGNIYFGQVIDKTSVIVPRDTYIDVYSP